MIRIVVAIAIAVAGLIVGFVIGAVVRLSSIPDRAAFFWAGLFFGIVLGFLLAWLLEEAVRRNRELMRQVATVQQTAQQLPTPTAMGLPAVTVSGESSEVASQTLADFLRKRDEEVHGLRTELDQAEAEMNRLREDFEAYMRAHPDDLTVIKGIGPVYQRKLRDIGINTFRQLAEADKAWLHRILDIKEWQRVDLEVWMAQAKDWTQRG